MRYRYEFLWHFALHVSGFDNHSEYLRIVAQTSAGIVSQTGARNRLQVSTKIVNLNPV